MTVSFAFLVMGISFDKPMQIEVVIISQNPQVYFANLSSAQLLFRSWQFQNSAFAHTINSQTLMSFFKFVSGKVVSGKVASGIFTSFTITETSILRFPLFLPHFGSPWSDSPSHLNCLHQYFDLNYEGVSSSYTQIIISWIFFQFPHFQILYNASIIYTPRMTPLSL